MRGTKGYELLNGKHLRLPALHQNISHERHDENRDRD
jgi:hypothetical protein